MTKCHVVFTEFELKLVLFDFSIKFDNEII